MAVIGLDWDLKIDAFYLLDHSQHKHQNNHQHFNHHDELIWTTAVGRIKKRWGIWLHKHTHEWYKPYPSTPYSETYMPVRIPGPVAKSKDTSETSTVSIFTTAEE